MCLTFLQHFMPLCVILALRKRLSLVYFISFSYHVFIDRSESIFIGKNKILLSVKNNSITVAVSLMHYRPL